MWKCGKLGAANVEMGKCGKLGAATVEICKCGKLKDISLSLIYTYLDI